MNLRVGQGVDVHRFGGPGPLVLGGVRVPGAHGLVGHSDADALSHALADAVLGAAGLGDIGAHFPDTDERFAGADSLGLLAEVVRRSVEAGWVPLNADCTVVAEAPRLAPHLGAMGRRLSAVLGAPVNVKATRGEGLGALGRHEGLVALAVVLAGPALRP